MSLPTTISNLTPLQANFENMVKANMQGANTLKGVIQQNFEYVWNNPNYTPQEMFDLWGTSAGLLFQAIGIAYQLIILQDPTYTLPTPPATFQINADGTVTTPAPITTP
jgi:hypothetical protein